jgi:hypothetical protein
MLVLPSGLGWCTNIRAAACFMMSMRGAPGGRPISPTLGAALLVHILSHCLQKTGANGTQWCSYFVSLQFLYGNTDIVVVFR